MASIRRFSGLGASLAIQQAAAQALKRQAHVLSPAAADAIRRLRNLLYDSAGRDGVRVCDFSKDPVDTWYPYGMETECRIRHARTPNSEFRKGIHWTFQHNWSTNENELSNELVEPITKLLMNEAMMQEPEARNIVWNHYQYVYGHFPAPTSIPKEPSRVPMAVIPRPREEPAEGPLVPMPPPLPGEPGGEAYPGEAEGDLLPEEPSNGALVAEGEPFPWMWVGIGAGALVVIGGVAYLATRKGGPR